MGVMDEVCITISEGDVIIFLLDLFYRPLIQVVDIGEWLIPCFPDVVVLGPMCLPNKMRSAENRPDLLYLQSFCGLALLSLT